MRRYFLASCITLLFTSACGSADDSSGGQDSVATTVPTVVSGVSGSSSDTADTNGETTSNNSGAASTTSTLVPVVNSGYEVVTVEAQRPYITIEGGTCDLSRPWSVNLDVVAGGLSGVVDYTPSGDGLTGSVLVTFTVAGTDFTMTGTSTYTITPLDTTAQLPTTTTTGTTDVISSIDLPKGALRIQYGSIEFTTNPPGANLPTLPSNIWGPPLLAPAPRDC